MSKQISSARFIALAAPLLLWGTGIGIAVNPARADDCLAAPKSAPPKGSHWYYHTDRAKQRKCWFLRAVDQPKQHDATQSETTTAPAIGARAAEKPLAATADAPLSTKAGGDAASLPLPRPQPASATSATTHEPGPQRIQEQSTAPSTPAAAVPQAIASPRTDAPAPAASPATAIIWPDPPAFVSVKTQNSNPSDARTDSVPSTVGASVAHDSEAAAQDNATSIPAAKTANSSAATLAELSLLVLLGLALSGLLYRWLMNIAARRDRRIIIDPPDWIDARHEHEARDDWQRREFINKREQFIDDLRLSLVPAAGDYSAHRSQRANDERRNDAGRMARASRFTDGLSERENKLAQLIRNLDQLLQSSKDGSPSGIRQHRSDADSPHTLRP